MIADLSPVPALASGLDIAGLLRLEARPIAHARIAGLRHLKAREHQLRLACQSCGIAHELGRLSAVSVLRLVKAPILGRLLSSGDTDSNAARALLLEWIGAERRLVGERSPVPVGWTALGDYRFDPAGGEPLAAPRLRGIVLDGASPYFAVLPLVPPARRAFIRQLGDVEQARAKLALALAMIDHAAPSAAEMIASAFHVIYVYADERSGLSSGSPRHFPGMASFGNADASAVSVVQIADALLHEATHSVLYIAEEEAPFFRTATVEEPRVTSPWTGASLAMHSFVHACCVWYVLAIFWARVLESEDAPSEAPGLFRRSARGFLGRDFDEALAVVAGGLTLFARDLLRTLATTARSRWAHENLGQ